MRHHEAAGAVDHQTPPALAHLSPPVPPPRLAGCHTIRRRSGRGRPTTPPRRGPPPPPGSPRPASPAVTPSGGGAGGVPAPSFYGQRTRIRRPRGWRGADHAPRPP